MNLDLGIVDRHTDDLDRLDRATHYRLPQGVVLTIAHRTPCPVCGRTIQLHTEPVPSNLRQGSDRPHWFATYSRLHFRCGPAVTARFGLIGSAQRQTAQRLHRVERRRRGHQERLL